MKYKYIALMLAASVLCGCKARNGQDETSSAGFAIQGNEIRIEDGSPLEGKLVLSSLGRENVRHAMTVTASVSPRPDSYAEVGAPFGGRVTRIAVRLGDRVYKGQVLFEMSSPDFMDAAGNLESRKEAYRQGDSSLLDYLMAVRVYNDTAEACIGARSALFTAWSELINAVGTEI